VRSAVKLGAFFLCMCVKMRTFVASKNIILMRRVYLSGCFGSSVSRERLFGALQRSVHFCESFGYSVYCPSSVDCNEVIFTHWLRTLPAFFMSDLVIFPTFWECSKYSKVEMWMCRILNKSFMVKMFD
jgi:hypothetical protein